MNLKLNEEWFYLKCKNLKLHKRIYIAYSGGVDSSVLLYLSKNLKKFENFKIKALHVNHSYNKMSEDWSFFCKKQCEILKIPIYIYKNKKKITENNIEEKLRIIRYNLFLKIIKKNSTLILAHNKNDNIETILLNTFRGSANLTNEIKEKNKLNHINIIRPFIDIDKKEIIEFAEKKKINHITDFSNFDTKFKRNYIRHKIIKNIENEWLGFKETFKKNIKIQKNINYIINIWFFDFLKFEIIKKNSLLINYINKIPIFLRFEIIRRWIKKNNKPAPSNKKMIELNKLINSESSYNKIKIDDYEIIKYKKNIYIKNINIEIKKKLKFVYENTNIEKKINIKKIKYCKKKKNLQITYRCIENTNKDKYLKYKKNIIYINGFWVSLSIKNKIIFKFIN